jgi:cell division protein FtsB
VTPYDVDLGKRLFSSRWLLVGLAIAGLGLQAELWFSDDGFRKTSKLRAAVADQSALNDSLRQRNGALDAEVINLKQGVDAAEERARTDLGMIGESETFYQVVPVANSTG